VVSTSWMACLLLANPGPPTEQMVVDRVDLVEVNHYYDEHGRHVFDQTIFYDWCPVQCRYNVRAWRLVKTVSQLPHRDWRTGEYVAVWHDGSVLRKVRADSFRESWTQYDPELIEQDYLPKDQRRDLRRPLAGYAGGSAGLFNAAPARSARLTPSQNPAPIAR